MASEDVVILSAARTPMGGFQGDLSGMSATELGSVAIKAAVERAGIQPGDVDETLMGNVLNAGLGQAPARQASIGAGIPNTAPCTTVSKVCGSGMKAVMIASDQLALGHADILVAGGMDLGDNRGRRQGHRQCRECQKPGCRFSHASLLLTFLMVGRPVPIPSALRIISKGPRTGTSRA